MSDYYFTVYNKQDEIIKSIVDSDVSFIIDYFKLYNTPDYYVSCIDIDNRQMLFCKQRGISL